MYKNKLVGVVVPAHNEESFVGDVIENVPEFVDRIYPVDDCSTDGTWATMLRAASVVNGRYAAATAQADEIATGTAAALQTDGGVFDTRAVAIQHERNRGVGAAIKTGYRQAVQDGLDVVAVMNGDGQMDPAILDQIIEPVVDGDVDYAKGNRLGSSDNWHGMSGWRLFGNHLLTYLTRVASGYWTMNDPQNGYTAISVDALEQIDYESLYDEYGFLNDMLVRLKLHDMRIADVEMHAVYGEEKSGIRYRRFIPRLSWLLLRRFVQRLRVEHLGEEAPLLALPYLLGFGVGALLLVVFSAALVSGNAGFAGIAGAAVFCVVVIGIGLAVDRRRSGPLDRS